MTPSMWANNPAKSVVENCSSPYPSSSKRSWNNIWHCESKSPEQTSRLWYHQATSTRYHACPFGRCCPVRTSSRDSVLYRQWILYPKPAQPCFQFPYSIQYQDEANRPPLLKYSVFNGQDKYKLKQTAEQASIALLHSKICWWRKSAFSVDIANAIIVLIRFSPVVSETTVQQLEDTIETHLKQFKELFPMVNVTPQMHYLMIHVPKHTLDLGPLIRHSCMRFEARHQYFKDLATRQNFKNICLSLA